MDHRMMHEFCISLSDLLSDSARLSECRERIAELEAENAELRKDAARYRWLRSRDTGPYQIWKLVSDNQNEPLYMELKAEEALDAAIDAAMGEQP